MQSKPFFRTIYNIQDHPGDDCKKPLTDTLVLMRPPCHKVSSESFCLTKLQYCCFHQKVQPQGRKSYQVRDGEVFYIYEVLWSSCTHLPKDILVSSGKWTFINIQEKIELEQNFPKVLQLQETGIQQISLEEMKENILLVL